MIDLLHQLDQIKQFESMGSENHILLASQRVVNELNPCLPELQQGRERMLLSRKVLAQGKEPDRCEAQMH